MRQTRTYKNIGKKWYEYLQEAIDTIDTRDKILIKGDLIYGQPYSFFYRKYTMGTKTPNTN